MTAPWQEWARARASQTGWALLALMAAGEAHSSTVARGIRYLIATQKTDGTWDEDQYTGTGFPKYFMIKYHIYRNCFPLSGSRNVPQPHRKRNTEWVNLVL